MGMSTCRLCGQPNGNLMLTDGFYEWPSGLVHYIEDHHLRLPLLFALHAMRIQDGALDSDRILWKRESRRAQPGGPHPSEP